MTTSLVGLFPFSFGFIFDLPWMITLTYKTDPLWLRQGVNVDIPVIRRYTDYSTDFLAAYTSFGYTGNIGIYDRKKKEFFAATRSIIGDEYMSRPYNRYEYLKASTIGDIITLDKYKNIAAFYPGKKIYQVLSEPTSETLRRPIDYKYPWEDASRLIVSPGFIGGLNKPTGVDIQPMVYSPRPLTGETIVSMTKNGAQLDYMIFSHNEIKDIKVFDGPDHAETNDLTALYSENIEWAQKHDRFWELILKDTTAEPFKCEKGTCAKPINLEFDVTLENGAVVSIGSSPEVINGIPPPLVNLEIEGVGESQEEIEGGFVMLNDDDDDKDGKADNDPTQPRPVANEDDLVKLTIHKVEPEIHYQGTVTLKVTDGPGANKIKIWDNTKTNEITLPKTYSTPSELPKELWVEGVAVSGTAKDVELVLEYTKDGETYDDKIRITVIKVDVNVDSDNNGVTEEYDNLLEEEKPGCIISKNLEGDTSEGDPVKDEVKAVKLTIQPVLSDTVAILSADNGLKIWADSGKSIEIVLPKTYDPTITLPASVYVDGITIGLKNIKLVYKIKDDKEIKSDTARILVTETPSWSPAKAKVAYVWASLKTNANGNQGNNLGWNDADEFENQIIDQGWQVVWFEDTTGDTDADFGSCTIANYKKMKDCGIFTVVTHGEKGAHLAVYAEYSVAGRTAIDNWISGEIDMTRELIPPTPADPNWIKGVYYARVSSKWHSANWSATLNTNKAIALWSICYSATANPGNGEVALKEAAGGRWRSGYINPTDWSEAKDVNKRFLERMNGISDNGKKRTAGEAFEGGLGYTANVRMRGNNWTTLCPAPMVVDAVFPEPSANKRHGWGCIIFDTYMNDTVLANTALKRLNGGNTSNHRWIGNSYGKFIIGFDYDESQNVETKMQAVGKECRNSDPDGGRRLDGNRVSPNDTDAAQDNREWPF